MSIIYTHGSMVFDKRETVIKQGSQPRKLQTFHDRNDRFTIKALIQNIKLKQRIRNVLDRLPSRRHQKLQEYHYSLLNDQADKTMNLTKQKESVENKINEDVPIFIHEAQASQIRKIRRIQSIMNKQKTSQSKFWKFVSEAGQRLANALQNIPIVDPNVLWKLLWDCIICMKILVLCFIASVRLTDFNDSLSTYSSNSSHLLVVFIILQSVDMMLSANTGYYYCGKLVKRRSEISKMYLKKNGVLDIITLQALLFELTRWKQRVTFTEISSNIHSFYPLLCNIEAIILLLYFVKGMRITKLMNKLEEEFQLNRRSLNILQLVKLLVFVLIVSHVFACIWLFTGKNSNLNVTWISFYRLQNESWKTQYIRAQYFASVTMITVGYGDTVPQNETEQVVQMIGMMLTCGVFAYSINSIGNILSEFQKEMASRKESMLIISQYMRDKNIQRNLQSEIREYLEYYWKEWNETQIEKEEQIISQLSDHLRRDLLIQANNTIINQKSLLSQFFSDFFIQKIIHIIKEFKATPNQTIICDSGAESRKGIVFFVEKGEFEIYHKPHCEMNLQNHNELAYNNNNSNNFQIEGQNSSNDGSLSKSSILQQTGTMKKVKTIGVGESFGFESFFTDQPHSVVVKSKDFCKLLYIDRADFIELMKKHSLQEDYEKFCFIRDSLINDNNLTLLGTKCLACKKFDHTLNECSYIHFITNKLNLIARFNISSEITERIKGIRRRPFKRRINPLINLDYFAESAYDFIEQNEQYIEEVLNYEEVSFMSNQSFYDCQESESVESSNDQSLYKENNAQQNNRLIPLIELDQQSETTNEGIEKLKDKNDLSSSSTSSDDKSCINSPQSKNKDTILKLQEPQELVGFRSPKSSFKKQGFAQSSPKIQPIEHKYDDNQFLISSISQNNQSNLNFVQTPSNQRKQKHLLNGNLDRSPLNNQSPFNRIHQNDRPDEFNLSSTTDYQMSDFSTHQMLLKQLNREKKISMSNFANKQVKQPQHHQNVHSTPINFTSNKRTSIFSKDLASNFKDSVINKRESILSQKELIFNKRDSLPYQKDTPRNKRESVSNRKESVINKRDSVSNNRESIFNKMESISNKKTYEFNQDHFNTKQLNTQQQNSNKQRFMRQTMVFQQIDFQNLYAHEKNENQRMRRHLSNIQIQQGISKPIQGVDMKNDVGQQQQPQLNTHQEDINNYQNSQGYYNSKFIDEFEKMKSFKFYFPQYNSDRIISNLKKKRNLLMQKQINFKNKGNDEITSLHQSIYPANKMQKYVHEIKAGLGFVRSNTRHPSSYQSRNESLIFKQNIVDSQVLSTYSPKKAMQQQQNFNQNNQIDKFEDPYPADLLSFTQSQNCNTINNENIVSQDKLTDAVPKDDFNFNKESIDKLVQPIIIRGKRSFEKVKHSQFNVKFAPLKLKMQKKMASFDSQDLESNL